MPTAVQLRHLLVAKLRLVSAVENGKHLHLGATGWGTQWAWKAESKMTLLNILRPAAEPSHILVSGMSSMTICIILITSCWCKGPRLQDCFVDRVFAALFAESLLVSSTFFTDDKRPNVHIRTDVQVKIQSHKVFDSWIKFYKRLLSAGHHKKLCWFLYQTCSQTILKAKLRHKCTVLLFYSIRTFWFVTVISKWMNFSAYRRIYWLFLNYE